LKHAKVFFTSYPPKYKGQAKSFLVANAKEWQNRLGKKLTLKYKPRFNFIFDKGQENAFLVE
jgi:ribosome-binding factor A